MCKKAANYLFAILQTQLTRMAKENLTPIVLYSSHFLVLLQPNKEKVIFKYV